MLKDFYQKHLKRRRALVLPLIFAGVSYNVFVGGGPAEVPAPRARVAADVACALDAQADPLAGAGAQGTVAASAGPRRLVVQFGDDVPAVVQHRVADHLRSVSAAPVELVAAGVTVDVVDRDALVVGVGDTATSRELIAPADLDALGPEGYLLRSGRIGQASAIAVDGKATRRHGAADVGAVYGAYALLESLGFGFLHPLEPTAPLHLPAAAPEVDRATSPRWPVRGLQLHTMHPLELTDLLQGWGPGGPDDAAGWEAMTGEWDTFLEWLVANGQNRVHWVWLGTDAWGDFARSPERIARIKRLVDRAHAFGIEVGLDVPLRLQQQNAARLVHTAGDLADETRQIEAGVAYVMRAGFDYLVTESGSTEFTAVEPKRMLAWMDALTATAADDHGVPVFIKVHASTGQYAEGFADPTTDRAINFNFLPHYADRRLGVLPHTVQHYALDDPAPTYGNMGFDHIRRFLQEQAGRRPTVWHPETAYWVSFDNDVPLFLPLYASRRVRDLRLLAGDEQAGRMGRGEHAGAMMDGQLTFSSGWEWGYWLQEVVAARAAWDPHLEHATDDAALAALLAPVERVFGQAGRPLVDWIVDYSRAQQALMIEGRVGGQAPDDVTRRNGQAYLQGWETWDDVSDILADRLGLEHGRMQPERVGLGEMRGRGFDDGVYGAQIDPLLAEMEARFEALTRRLVAMGDKVPANALGLYEELLDASRITWLRARQVHALYDHVDHDERGEAALADSRLAEARAALDEALAVVAHRQRHYRVPLERIAGWRDNPTAYPFTYLWTVRSLYYWQRDEALAVEAPANPCHLNVIDPIDVGLGDGWMSRTLGELAGAVGRVPAFSGLARCMQAPDGEPTDLPAAY